MRPIKFGVQIPTTNFEAAKQAAIEAETLGYFSASLNDHLYAVGDRTKPQIECFTTLAAIATVTSQIKLMPIVASMPWRTPAMLAKIASTLDVASNGRFIAGLGAGWLIDEHETYGYRYLPNRERVAAFQEGIKIIKALWTQDEVSFAGSHYQLKNAVAWPKPVQKPHPPILIGGGGELILKVMGEEADLAQISVANSSGVVDNRRINTLSNERFGQQADKIRRFAQAAGRDPAAVELCGIASVTIATSPQESEKIAAEMARSRGFADGAVVRDHARVLIGTIDELKRELRHRIERYDVTCWVMGFSNQATRELFAHRIMPEFVTAASN